MIETIDSLYQQKLRYIVDTCICVDIWTDTLICNSYNHQYGDDVPLCDSAHNQYTMSNNARYTR